MRRKHPTGRNLPQMAPNLPVNTLLVQLLAQGVQEPETDRVPLLRALQSAQLLIPILQPAGRAGEGRADNLKMAVLERSDGLALAGFTDADAYRRFPSVQHLPYVAIAAVDLCRFARQGQFRAVLINPGGPVGYEMSPLEFQMVAERLLPGENGSLVVEQSTPARIGMPSERPEESVLQTMREIVEKAGAQEAYWFWLAIGGGSGHLGMAIAPGNPELIRAIGEQITPVWKATRPANPLFDILPLDDGSVSGSLSQTIRKAGESLLPHLPPEEQAGD